jgi:hypothetical protein
MDLLTVKSLAHTPIISLFLHWGGCVFKMYVKFPDLHIYLCFSDNYDTGRSMYSASDNYDNDQSTY